MFTQYDEVDQANARLSESLKTAGSQPGVEMQEQLGCSRPKAFLQLRESDGLFGRNAAVLLTPQHVHHLQGASQ